ncbi:MAG TPA: DUF2326 domain-containing protein [Pirellulales bacterium]|nr:DUF2326 domain-containing protein [Pirellulales bacterium]
MRLIELTSTRSSFKTVRFNQTGLSLIVGRHTQKQSKNIQSTYNGVGKSLSVALIHFCLGASKNKQFEDHLNGWDFTLTFEHGGRVYRVTRGVGEDKIHFDGAEMKLSKYKESLGELGVFTLPADVSGLTFRSLISFFVRPGRGSYNLPDAAVPQWTPYHRVLYQSFLLGLDYGRAAAKHDAMKQLQEQVDLAKKYKQDKELRDFYVGEKNAEIELASLSEKIVTLEDDLAKFVVASDYSEREAKANELRERIVDARNEEAILAVRLSDIELALTIRPDVTPDRVNRLYEEALIALPNAVTKRLSEVDAFHNRLRENRLNRLDLERKQAVAEQKKWQERRAGLERELDGLLQFLHAHRALDEYTENNRFLAELTARKRKIDDYVSLLAKYTDAAQRIRAEMGQATVDTTEYLKSAKPHLDRLMEIFRGYAREFYGDKPAGLVVANNDRDENQIRYNIEARIEHDQSDGINDVRIFCYDLLLLTLRERHNVDFLFHDSRLFADMDPHQRLTLFRLAKRVSHKNGLQYIATINEDQIESLREGAGQDFEQLFVATRVLNLTDEPNGSGKLLGIQIEMKYEEE